MSTLPFARLAADGDYLVIGPGVESDSFKLDNPVLDFSATEVLALQAGTGRFVVTSVTGGTGNVVGPAGATDNALARYDGATGTVIQNSVAVLSDAGILSGVTEIAGPVVLTDVTSINGAAVAPGGVGDVVGPAGATDNALARYDGATGKLVQNGLAVLSDAGALTGVVSIAGPVVLTGVTSINGAAVAPGGVGDVVGPAGATDNALARYDGATGKLVQNGLAVLSDAGALTGVVSIAGPLVLTGVTSINGAAVAPGGVGDVVGPGAATDNAFARYDGATGKLIQNAVLTLGDTGNIQLSGQAYVTRPNATAQTLGTLAGAALGAGDIATVAVGNNALRVASGAGNNTAVGNNSGQSVSSGANNTLIGAGAGVNITTGSNNICLGSGAGVTTTTASNQINIGGGGGLTSNQISIGAGQTTCFIQGIATTVGDGVNFVTASLGGQMGVSRLPWSYSGNNAGLVAAPRYYCPVGGSAAAQTSAAVGASARVNYDFSMQSLTASVFVLPASPGETLTFQVLRNGSLTGTPLVIVAPAAAGLVTGTQAQAVLFSAGDTMALTGTNTSGATGTSIFTWEIAGTRV